MSHNLDNVIEYATVALARSDLSPKTDVLKSYVVSLKEYYDWSPTSTEDDDGQRVLKPNNILSADPGRWIKAFSGARPNKVYYVSDVGGSDVSGTGSEQTPYKTISYALTKALNSGARIILMPGEYAEDIAIANLNIDITGSPHRSGLVYLTGNVAFANASSSIRVSGITLAGTVTFQGNGGKYLYECGVTNAATISKTDNGYLEFDRCDLEGITPSVSSGTVLLSNCKLSSIQLSGAATLGIGNSTASGTISGFAGGVVLLQDVTGTNITNSIVSIPSNCIYSLKNTTRFTNSIHASAISIIDYFVSIGLTESVAQSLNASVFDGVKVSDYINLAGRLVLSPLLIADQTSDFSIAANDVGRHSAIKFSQNTGGITATLEDPADTSASVLYLINSGTADIATAYGDIAAGAVVIAAWNGSDWVFASGGSGATKFSATAKSAIAAGNAVRLYDDGQVVPFDLTVRALTQGQSTAGTKNDKLLYVGLTNQVLFFHRDGTPAKVSIGSIVGKTVTWSQTLSFGATQTASKIWAHYDSAIGKALAAYINDSGVVVVTSFAQTGGVWAVQQSTTIAGSPTQLAISSNGANFFLLQVSTSDVMTVQRLDVSDVYIGVLATSSGISNIGSASFMRNDLSTDFLVVTATHNSNPHVRPLTAALAFGTAVQISNIATYPGDSTIELQTTGPNGVNMAIYSQFYGQVIKFVFTSLTNITSLTQATLWSTATSGTSISAVDGDDIFVSFIDGINLTNQRRDVVSIKETYTESLSEAIWVKLDIGKYVGASKDGINIKSWYSADDDVSAYPVIGIAQANAAANDVVTVSLAGELSSAHSSLTPGKKYYADSTGAISDTLSDIFVGTAVSDTKINVDFAEPQAPSVVSTVVVDNSLTVPPTVAGRYIVPASGATGVFVGNEGKYADYNGETWAFTTPTVNDTVLISSGVNAGTSIKYSASGWSKSSGRTLNIYVHDVTKAYVKDIDVVIKDDRYWLPNEDVPENTVFVEGSVGATWRQIRGDSVAGASNGSIYPTTGAYLALNDTWQAVPGLAFNASSSGIYDVNSHLVRGAANARFYVCIRVGGVVQESQVQHYGWGGVEAGLDTNFIVSAITGQEIAIVVRSPGGGGEVLNDANYTLGRRPSLRWNKISGTVPSTGESINHSFALKTANQGLPNNTTNITFESVDGNVSYSSGEFTLEPGNKYDLEGGIITSSISASQFCWYNITQGTWLGVAQQAMSPTSGSTLSFTGGLATASITPTSQIKVALRQRTNFNLTISNSDFTTHNVVAWARVAQAGTTNVAAFCGYAASDWNINNSYPKHTIVVNNSFPYRSNEAIPAGTSFVVGTTGQTWQYLGNQTPSWTDGGALNITATSSNPTKPTNRIVDKIYYRQIGAKTYQVSGVFRYNDASGAASGFGDYLISLPAGLTFNTSLPFQATNQDNVRNNTWIHFSHVVPDSTVNFGRSDGYGGNVGGIIPWDSTRFRILLGAVGSAIQCWHDSWFGLTGSGVDLQIRFSFTLEIP